jgi:hypothetical protein
LTLRKFDLQGLLLAQQAPLPLLKLLLFLLDGALCGELVLQ